MRIRRGLLFWGLFLIPLGAIPLLVRAGTLDAAQLTDVWRLWPVALILLGVAVLLGRHQAGLIGVMVAALALGGLAGSALASGPQWIGDIGTCVPSSDGLEANTSQGAFSGSAEVVIDVDCGRANVTTGPGGDWRVDVRSTGGPPVIAGSGTGLELRAPADAGRHRYEWDVVLPAEMTRRLDLRANAAASRLDLEGMALASLSADVNAGDLTVDGGAALIERLDVELNAGRARITLGSLGATTGQLIANAGALELCVPAEVGLDLRVDEQLTFAHDLDSKGLTREGDRWTRAASGGAPTVELRIEGNAANLTLDPEEGCS
jgi:hypothetical protein